MQDSVSELHIGVWMRSCRTAWDVYENESPSKNWKYHVDMYRSDSINYSEDSGEILSIKLCSSVSVPFIISNIVNNLIAPCLTLFALYLAYTKFDICMHGLT
jgi:hypothetical protein